MTVTHIDDTLRNDPVHDDVFVPRYAQTGKRKKGGVRTWMILAPIGALAVIGGGAAMMMGGGEAEPLVAERAAPPVQPTAPLESSTAPAALTTDLPANVSITETAPAPVVREAPPAPPPAVQRRQPVERRAAPVETAPVVEQAPVVPTGPQPYAASSASATAPAPAPSIVPAPLD